MMEFKFGIRHQDGKTQARTGLIHTAHGSINTPCFVPVGTQATVKSLTPEDLEVLNTRLFFVNTYHTYLRPGLDIIKKAGGLHRFMHWERPLITDSGGFQVFSLGSKRYARKNDNGGGKTRLVRITEEGVTFKSHWDGSEHNFSPENSMKYQWVLGSDIHIAFDDCTPYPVTRKQAEKSTERTHRWAERSLEAHKSCLQQSLRTNQNSASYYQALYGVVQGSVFQDLRIKSVRYISSMDFDGIAVGGVSVGESKTEMYHVLDWVMPYFPQTKPRHLLGVGEIDDIFALIEHGIDTFDCVQPTRLARMGHVFISNVKNNMSNMKYQLDITKNKYESDMSPIDSECSCYTCRNFSKAYLHHLFKVRELLAYRLATIHNIHYVNTLITHIQKAIESNKFLELKKRWIYNDYKEAE